MFEKIRAFRERQWYGDSTALFVIAHPIGTISTLIDAAKATKKAIDMYPLSWELCDGQERIGLVAILMYLHDPKHLRVIKPEERVSFMRLAAQFKAEMEES